MAHLLGHHGGLWHCDCGGRLAGLCHWQLTPGLCSGLPTHDSLQRIAQSGIRAYLGGMVWYRHWPRHPSQRS